MNLEFDGLVPLQRPRRRSSVVLLPGHQGKWTDDRLTSCLDGLMYVHGPGLVSSMPKTNELQETLFLHCNWQRETGPLNFWAPLRFTLAMIHFDAAELHQEDSVTANCVRE